MRFFLKLKPLLFIILIGITFTSCTYKDIEVVNIEKVKLGKIKSDYITLDAKLKIKNPNNYKIKISKYEMDIVVNKQNFQMLEPNADILVPKKFEGIISVPVTMRSKEVLSFRTIATMYKIFTSKKLNVEAKGSVSIKFLFFSKKIKVNEAKTIDL